MIQNCLLCFIDLNKNRKTNVFLNKAIDLLYKGKDCFSLDSLPSQVIKTYKEIAKLFSWSINTDIEDIYVYKVYIVCQDLGQKGDVIKCFLFET